VPSSNSTEKDLRNVEPGTVSPPARKPFERPRIFRRGTLPKVTTAFGGTFTP